MQLMAAGTSESGERKGGNVPNETPGFMLQEILDSHPGSLKISGWTFASLWEKGQKTEKAGGGERTTVQEAGLDSLP